MILNTIPARVRQPRNRSDGVIRNALTCRTGRGGVSCPAGRASNHVRHRAGANHSLPETMKGNEDG